jgi:hypothetical protein
LGRERIGIPGSWGISYPGRVNADNGMHEPKPVGNGTEGTTALAGNLCDSEALGAVEAENGEKAGRLWDGGRIEAVENLQREKAGWEEIVDGSRTVDRSRFHSFWFERSEGGGTFTVLPPILIFCEDKSDGLMYGWA